MTFLRNALLASAGLAVSFSLAVGAAHAQGSDTGRGPQPTNTPAMSTAAPGTGETTPTKHKRSHRRHHSGAHASDGRGPEPTPTTPGSAATPAAPK